MNSQGGRKPPLLTRIVGLAKQNPIVALIVLDSILKGLEHMHLLDVQDLPQGQLVAPQAFMDARDQLQALVDER